MLLSEYWSDDKTKRAEVHKYDGNFHVDFFENEEYIMTEKYINKSQSWAEAAAENYTMGIKVIQNGKRR
jgi:Tol biopolymer transport system component